MTSTVGGQLTLKNSTEIQIRSLAADQHELEQLTTNN
jgi:hypothetical protein